jgi:hypothetical protein
MTESEPHAGPAESAPLDRWLGRQEMASWMGRGCSAAEAQVLRAIRSQKLYRTLNLDWDAFCTLHLGMSCRSADRIIEQLNEFGETFFNLTQLVKVPPADYRAIQPAIHDNQIQVEERAIDIKPENRAEIVEAVRKLRGPRPQRPAYAAVEKRFIHLFAEAAELFHRRDHTANELGHLKSMLNTLSSKARELEQDFGQAVAHAKANHVIDY